MSSNRFRKPDIITPMHVVMICLVTTTVAAGSLLLSAAESKALVDGAVDWQVESPLRAVVQLLCLNYEWPTVHAGEVKNFVLGIGAGLAILALAIAVIAERRDDETAGIGDEPLAAPPPPIESHDATAGRKGQITPLVAAQVLVGLFLLWSFASSRWSAAPDLAIGGSIWITICFLWAMGIGNGLNRSAALIASRMLVGVAAITALVALWY